MKVAIIGRTEILYETACRLRSAGYEIACILTAKEAPEYRCGTEDFRVLATEWNVPFVSSARIGDCRDFLEESQADIAVSINYSGVIPEEITQLFPLGILNAHGGDLPRYRGNACQAWAIINGEKLIGLCIHRMIGGELDSGDIIAREYMTLKLETKVGEVLSWIANQTPNLFLEALQRLQVNGAYILEQQSKNPSDALRCYSRRPEDGRIGWDSSAITVLRLINACNKPYAGAFCDFEGEKLIIWDAEIVDSDEKFCAMPGQVTLIGEGFIEVACRGDKIRIKQIEIAGQVLVPNKIITSTRKRLG